jgi:hypothetical protein
MLEYREQQFLLPLVLHHDWLYILGKFVSQCAATFIKKQRLNGLVSLF